VARSRRRVADTAYRWHLSPDGGACFAAPDGSGDYVYVSNSETLSGSGGGASAIRFAANGKIRMAIGQTVSFTEAIKLIADLEGGRRIAGKALVAIG